VLFADETIFRSNDSTTYWVQREPNTDFAPGNTVDHVPHPIKSNGWLCFAAAGIGTLYMFTETLNGQYMRSILDACLLESAERVFHLPGAWHLLHDNSPNHRADVVKDWLFRHGISMLDFPPYSPDLNPIENLIADVKRRQYQHVVSDVDELQEAVIAEWNATDVRYLQKLVHSMPRRCAAVIEAKGYMTKY